MREYSSPVLLISCQRIRIPERAHPIDGLRSGPTSRCAYLPMAARPNSQFRPFAKREEILLRIPEEEVARVAQARTTLRTSTSKVLEQTKITTHPVEITSIRSLCKIRRNLMRTTQELLTSEGSVSASLGKVTRIINKKRSRKLRGCKLFLRGRSKTSPPQNC